MVPLEQYENQIGHQLWYTLSYSLIPQVETDLWCDLDIKLRNELDKETPRSMLREELEHQCSR